MTPLGLQRLLTVLPPLLLIGSLASADAITGRVVDANGVGVAGVDIDFVSLGSGGNPHEANDGTDANGNFLTTVDAGVYEIRFYAPAPPTTVLLTGVLTPVTVVGTKNLGTITLVAGASVQGTVHNQASLPVGNVRLDVFREDTGARVLMKGNVTSAFGTFNIAVPKNVPLRTQVLTNLVLGQVLVPREIFATIPASTNIGVLTLDTGFHLTGTVLSQSSTPIASADIDVTVLPGGETLFTPSDNTNSLGVFDVVVPAGNFDLEVNRPTALVLVGAKANNLTVNAPMNLGVLVLRNGVFLSGTVRDRRNLPVLAADVNVYELATGQSLALGSDNTNAAGFYSVVVPTGALDVVFSPPGPHGPWAKDWHRNQLISANTTLDGHLNSAPSTVAPTSQAPRGHAPVALPFGAGTAGSLGVPFISTSSSPAGLTLRLFGGRPGALAQLGLGMRESELGLEPGVHLVHALVRLPVRLDAAGNGKITLPVAASALGHTLHAQFGVLDPLAQRGLALSHVVALTPN